MRPLSRLPLPRHPGDASGGAGPQSTLDAAALARLRQLDPDGRRGFVAQVLRTFDGTLDRHLLGLSEAAAGQDIEAAGRVAHTLKSSSAAIGALAFARCCEEVERLAKRGDPATLGAPLAALVAEGERVRVAVRDILQS